MSKDESTIISEINMKIGQNLKAERQLSGYSKKQLGEFVGLTDEEIKDIETGKSEIGAARLYRLSVCLERPITIFYDDIVEPLPEALKSSLSYIAGNEA